MNIAAGQWMNSIKLRRRDLGRGAVALGATATLPGSSLAQNRAESRAVFEGRAEGHPGSAERCERGGRLPPGHGVLRLWTFRSS
jgi:hypothetical protein